MTVDLVTGTNESLHLTEEDERRPGVFRRLLREPAAVVALIFVLVVVLLAVCAPLLTPYDPIATQLADVLAPPFTPEHPLGATVSAATSGQTSSTVPGPACPAQRS